MRKKYDALRIANWYYLKQMKQVEIAKVLGISQSYVSKVIVAANKRIKENLKGRVTV